MRSIPVQPAPSVAGAPRRWRPLIALVLLAGVAAGPSAANEDPLSFVAFVEEPTGTCVNRNAVQILVRSTHPTRPLRVWLDRYVMGTGTGDRSRTDLVPGAAAEPLGCSRNLNGVQEWRPVRAKFLD